MALCATESRAIVGDTTFTIGTSEYAGDVDQIVKERRELEDGGKVVIKSARVMALKPQFEAKPDIGLRVGILGETLRIRSVADDGDHYVLLLVETDK